MVKKVIPRRNHSSVVMLVMATAYVPIVARRAFFMREDVRPTFQAVVGTTSMVGVGTEVGTEEGITA